MPPISKTQLERAGLDAESLADVINGAATINGTGIVTTRLGRNIKTLSKVIADLASSPVGTSAIAAVNARIDALAFRNVATIVGDDWSGLTWPEGTDTIMQRRNVGPSGDGWMSLWATINSAPSTVNPAIHRESAGGRWWLKIYDTRDAEGSITALTAELRDGRVYHAAGPHPAGADIPATMDFAIFSNVLPNMISFWRPVAPPSDGLETDDLKRDGATPFRWWLRLSETSVAELSATMSAAVSAGGIVTLTDVAWTSNLITAKVPTTLKAAGVTGANAAIVDVVLPLANATVNPQIRIEGDTANRPIVRSDGTPLAIGDLRAGVRLRLNRVGTEFRTGTNQLASEGAAGVLPLFSETTTVTAQSPVSARSLDTYTDYPTNVLFEAATLSPVPLGAPQAPATAHLWTEKHGGVTSQYFAESSNLWARSYDGSAFGEWTPQGPIAVNGSTSAPANRDFNAALLTSPWLRVQLNGDLLYTNGPNGSEAYSGILSTDVVNGSIRQTLLLAGDEEPFVRVGGSAGAWLRKAPGLENQLIVAFGDSITYGFGTSEPTAESFPAIAARKLGARLLKVGATGAQMDSATAQAQAHKDASFVEAVLGNASQVAAASRVLVAYGTNDFSRATVIGEIADTTRGTFYGAMREGYAAIVAANPAAKVVFATPLYRAVSNTDPSENLATNGAGHTLEDYRHAIRIFAARHNCQVIEGKSAGISDDNCLALMPDGMHPNAEGSQLWGESVAAGIGYSFGSALVAPLSGRIDALAESLSSYVVDDTDIGAPLIKYESGQIAIAQKPDGIDFIPSETLKQRMGSASGGSAAPDGAWAAAFVTDITGAETVEFTAHAGPGLIDRFRLRNGGWWPTPRKGRVLIGYGQSQTGIHQSGGEPVVWTTPPVPNHIYMLDDVQSGRGGLRGHMGGTPLRTATRLIPATTLATPQGIQDIASAMAATLCYLDTEPMVYACRTEGRGGMPLIGTQTGQGLWKDSANAETQQFANLIDSANRMVSLLTAEGYEVDEITVLFDHGEADGMAARTRQYYLDTFNGMAAAFQAAVSRPVHWLVTQPVSGEGPLAFNDWETRMAAYDIGTQANATAVIAKYDLPIGNLPDGSQDWVHTSYVGRVIEGEYYAHADHCRRNSEWVAPFITAHTISGNTVLVDYDCGLAIRVGGDSIPYPPLAPEGAQLIDTSAQVLSIEKVGTRRLKITCSADPSGGKLRIGYTDLDSANDYGRYPVGSTTIRDSWAVPSRWVDGVVLRRWAWGQEVQL